MVDLTSSINLKMSDSGGTEEDLGFYGDVISPLKSTKSSSVESPHSHEKNERNISSSSPLLDTQPLPAENISICPYCNKHFRKPRVLDCLHSMCEDCVIAQLDGRNDTKQRSGVTDHSTDFELEQSKTSMRPTPPGVIRCPICSQESHVGNDVRFVNFMLLDFVRLRNSAENGEVEKGERICRACKGEQPAVANCRHCCSDLCKNCVQAHRSMKMFDGHKVVMLSEDNADQNKTEVPVELALCSWHQLSFESVCSNCDELICKNCMEDHRDHKCIPINDTVYQYCKSKIVHIVGELEAKGQATAEARSAIPDRVAELSVAYDKCHEKVENAFQTLTEVIEDIKKQVFADLEKKRDEQEEYYNNLYHKIDLRMSMMQDALGFTNRILEKGTKVELCASRKKIYQQLLLLHRSMPDVNTEFDMDFDILPVPDLRKKLESLVGTVQCRVTAIPSKNKLLLSAINSNSTEQQQALGGSGDKDRMKSMSAVMAGPGWNYPMQGMPGPTSAPISMNTSCNQLALNGGNPGTIGMERRRITNRDLSFSNGFPNGFDTALLSGDLPSVNGAQNSDIFNVNRLNFDLNPSAPGSNRGLQSTNSFSSLEMSSNFANGFPDPFGQNKIWGGGQSFNNNNNPFGGFNLDGSFGGQRPKTLTDPRFDFSAMNGVLDASPFATHSRSSQCTTPAFDSSVFGMSGGGANAFSTGGGGGSARMPSTIEMSLHTIFGSSGMESLNTPQGITLGLDHEIAIADTNNHRCVVMNTDGKLLRQLGSSGTEEGCLYFPRKVVSLVRGHECRYIVLDRGPTQLFNRLQVFRNDGEFICRLITAPYHVEQINVMAINKENDQLIVIDNKNNVIAFSIGTVPQIHVVHAFNITGFVHEASDIAIYKDMYYITDYKTHVVVVYTLDGKFMHKFGNNTLTPYPVGIDISKSGDILVGDSHGNHFHIVVFNSKGVAQQDYKCLTQKVSRCTGLKITAEGYVITMSRQNSSVLVFNTLYMPSI